MALRTVAILRSSVRSSGTGLPLARSRSVGRTSGRASADGSMVVAIAGTLQS